jgi:hypothetical protein
LNENGVGASFLALLIEGFSWNFPFGLDPSSFDCHPVTASCLVDGRKMVSSPWSLDFLLDRRLTAACFVDGGIVTAQVHDLNGSLLVGSPRTQLSSGHPAMAPSLVVGSPRMFDFELGRPMMASGLVDGWIVTVQIGDLTCSLLVGFPWTQLS